MSLPFHQDVSLKPHTHGANATMILLALLAVIALCGLTARLLAVLPPRPRGPSQRTIPHVLIVLGSGGHTAEMISMLTRSAGELWSRIARRTYVVCAGDALSANRARDLEALLVAGDKGNCDYEIVTVPRARRIHQPLITTPLSSLRCLVACVRVLRKQGYPDLIIANGPATATILILASVMLRFIDAGADRTMRTVYVESWARVKRLSLSGRLLCWIADRVLVQWEQLDGAHGRGEYHGVLVA